MSEAPKRAMILAAGKGERMRPLTDHMPKPLLPVDDKPLIQHHIERLVNQGLSDIVINHAYLGEKIAAFIGTGQQFGAQIQLSAESEPLETGGGIFQALPLLNAEEKSPFLLVNGDVWMPFDYASLRLPSGSLCHLVLVPNPPHNPTGDFSLSPKGELLLASPDSETFTFSGVSVIHPDLFDGQQAGKFPLAPLIKEAIALGRATAQCYDGTWVDVGTPERLAYVESLVTEKSESEL